MSDVSREYRESIAARDWKINNKKKRGIEDETRNGVSRYAIIISWDLRPFIEERRVIPRANSKTMTRIYCQGQGNRAEKLCNACLAHLDRPRSRLWFFICLALPWSNLGLARATRASRRPEKREIDSRVVFLPMCNRGCPCILLNAKRHAPEQKNNSHATSNNSMT